MSEAEHSQRPKTSADRESTQLLRLRIVLVSFLARGLELVDEIIVFRARVEHALVSHLEKV